MDHLRAAFRWLSDLGTTPAQSTSERRRITLTNQCALLSGATFAVFLLLFPVMRYQLGASIAWPLVMPNGLGALAELLVLWLDARGFVTPARYLLLVGAVGGYIGAAFLVGAHQAFLYYYFPLVLVPFFVFERRRRAHSVALATFCFGAFAVVRWGLPDRGWLPIPYSRMGLLAFEASTAIYVSFLLAAIALLFTGETARAEAVAAEALTRSEELLLNILPASISARLKTGGRSLADGHADVTVLFADIVGFTELAVDLPPEEVVRMLNEVFSSFDDLTERFGLEKIKTIGDAYMVAGGLPEPRPDHVEVVARMALEMQRAIVELGQRGGRTLQLRIGLHTGPVVAGVIGKRKFIYDLWGDTVNTASRMESSGLPGAIQITREVQARLEGQFRTERRGTIQVKGKGEMETFFLRGENA